MCSGIYQPGKYSGSAQGFGGAVTVEIQVDAGRVCSMTADVSCETQKLAQPAATELVRRMIDHGSPEVDGVSGATITSNAIKQACANALTQAAQGQKPDLTHLRAGSYQTAALGYEDEILLETALSHRRIENVRILSAKETPGIGQVALEKMASRIVRENSLAVDAVSGATVTSSAVRCAVEEALRQAGGNIADFSTPPIPTEKEDCTVETDVVVIGAGMAGYCAAIEALDQGARVLLLEKLDIIGGTAIVAGGALMAANSYLNRERGDDSQELADWLYERQEKHHNISYAQIKHVVSHAGELVDWIHEKSGVDFQLGYGGGSPKQWSHRPVLLPEEPRNGHGTPRIIWGLDSYFRAHGGILMTSTRAESLITDETRGVIGVRAVSPTAKLAVYAKGGVIIAAGGYEADPEMVRRFAPNSIHMRSNGDTAGDTGDGIKMGEQIGAQLTYSGYLMSSWNHIEGIGRFGLDAMNMKHKYPCIELNGRMERFYNENTSPIQEKWEFAKDGTGEFYILFDSGLPEDICNKLEEAAQAGVVWKGESVASLAQAIGKSPLALESTVKRWNTMAHEGVDLDFGNAIIAPLETGPFYLGRIYEMSTGSYGGLKTTLNGQVVDREDKPICGLYAAGESANGEFFYRNYVCGGSSFSMCGVFGREAGRNAALRALNRQKLCQ